MKPSCKQCNDTKVVTAIIFDVEQTDKGRKLTSRYEQRPCGKCQKQVPQQAQEAA